MMIVSFQYVGMWRKSSVQRNVEILREDGMIVYSSSNTTQSGISYIPGGSLPSPNEVCRFISDHSTLAD